MSLAPDQTLVRKAIDIPPGIFEEIAPRINVSAAIRHGILEYLKKIALDDTSDFSTDLRKFCAQNCPGFRILAPKLLSLPTPSTLWQHKDIPDWHQLCATDGEHILPGYSKDSANSFTVVRYPGDLVRQQTKGLFQITRFSDHGSRYVGTVKVSAKISIRVTWDLNGVPIQGDVFSFPKKQWPKFYLVFVPPENQVPEDQEAMARGKS